MVQTTPAAEIADEEPAERGGHDARGDAGIGPHHGARLRLVICLEADHGEWRLDDRTGEDEPALVEGGRPVTHGLRPPIFRQAAGGRG